MPKIQKIILMTVAFLLVLLTGMELLINFTGARDQINREIKALLVTQSGQKFVDEQKINFQIKGKTAYSSFPLPHVYARNVVVENFVQDGGRVSAIIPEVRLHISLLKMLTARIDFKGATLVEPNIIIERIDVDNLDKFDRTAYEVNLVSDVSEYLLRTVNSNNSKIMESGIFVRIRNGHVSPKNTPYKTEISRINIRANLDKNLNFAGNFIMAKQQIDIHASLDRKKTSARGRIRLSNDHFNVLMVYNTAGENISDGSGDFSANIKNLRLMASVFLPTDLQNRINVIDNESLSAKLKFELKDRVLSVRDFVIESKNIAGTINATIDRKDNATGNNIVADFKILDVDKLIYQSAPNKVNVNHRALDRFLGQENSLGELSADDDTPTGQKAGYIRRQMSPNPIQIKLNIGQLNMNFSRLDNTALDMTLSNERDFSINSFSTEAAGKTSIRGERRGDGDSAHLSMRGEDLREFLKIFKISFRNANENSLKSFSAEGDIRTHQNNLYLTNFVFTASDIKSTGDIKIKFGDGIDYVAARINVDNLILDNYFKNIENMLFSSRPLREQILALNKFNSNFIFGLNIGNISYGGFSGKNYQFKVKYGNGHVSVYDTNLTMPHLNGISGDFSLDIRGEKPSISANIILEELLIPERTVKVSNDTNDETKKPDDETFLDRVFRLPTLEDFSGNISLNIKKGTLEKSNLEDLVFRAAVTNGTIDISDFNFKGLGGNSKFSGFLKWNQKKELNFVMDGCTYRLEDILYYFSGGLENLEGRIALSGIVNAIGNTRSEFMAGLNARAIFSGADVIVGRFGLTDLMVATFKLYSDNPVLKRGNETIVDGILFNPNTRTVFSKIDGSLALRNKTQGVLKIEKMSAFGINGNFSSVFQLKDRSLELGNTISTFIIMTGTKKKMVPIGLSIGLRGNTANPPLSKTANKKQIMDYISVVHDVVSEYKGTNEEFEEMEINDGGMEDVGNVDTELILPDTSYEGSDSYGIQVPNEEFTDYDMW